MKTLSLSGFLCASVLLALGCETNSARHPQPESMPPTTRNGEPLPGQGFMGAAGQSGASDSDTRSSGDTGARTGALTDPLTPGTNSPMSNPPSTAPITPSPLPGEPPAPAAAKLTDGEISAIMTAANVGEIDQGNLAQKQARDPGVRSFAKMMVDHHADALNKQMKLTDKLALAPIDSKKSHELKLGGERALVQLKILKGAAFDRAYIDLQVKEHQDLLDTLDRQILSSVQSNEFKAQLNEVRARVEQHLKMAQDLQTKLGSKGTRGLAPQEAPPAGQVAGEPLRPDPALA